MEAPRAALGRAVIPGLLRKAQLCFNPPGLLQRLGLGVGGSGRLSPRAGCEVPQARLAELPGVDLAGMEPLQALCAFLKCLEQLCREVVESPCPKVFRT